MYVYMFSAITGTFISVLRVFFLYIVAFGLTFYVLMQNQVCTLISSQGWLGILCTSLKFSVAQLKFIIDLFIHDL